MGMSLAPEIWVPHFFSMPSGADVAIYGKNMINLLIYGIYGIYIYIDTYIYGIYGHP